MPFWLSKGEILSLFAAFLALCDFVSIIFCNFGAYFSKESTKTYLLKFSCRISTSKREVTSNNPNSCRSMRISVDFIHKELGAVLSLTGDMAVVCAFFMQVGWCSDC